MGQILCGEEATELTMRLMLTLTLNTCPDRPVFMRVKGQVLTPTS